MPPSFPEAVKFVFVFPMVSIVNEALKRFRVFSYDRAQFAVAPSTRCPRNRRGLGSARKVKWLLNDGSKIPLRGFRSAPFAFIMICDNRGRE